MPRSRFLAPLLALSLAAALGGLAAAPAGAAAQPQQAAAAMPGDLADLQWGLTAIRARQVWAVTKGAGEVVAVIDTGADATNPDLQGQLVDGARLDVVTDDSGQTIGWTPVPVPAGESVDTYGHGTHVSGIIVAKDDGVGTVGVAPDAKVMPINIYDALASAWTMEEAYGAIATAVDYAAAAHVPVISMSLGGPELEKVVGQPLNADDQSILAAQDALCASITRATEGGALVVVAAGNDGLLYGGYGTGSVPSTCPDALSVAASDPDSRPAAFSSPDPSVAIAAPGDMILSTVPVDSPYAAPGFPYAEFSGTSMATPMVSAVAALAAASMPGASPAALRARLQSTAVDIALPGPDPVTGSGLVDAAAAVGAAADRASVDPVAFLPLAVRPAASTQEGTFTATWVPTLLGAMPRDYTLTIVDASTMQVVQSATVAADEVRYSWSAAAGAKQWVFLAANYAAGPVRATPAYLDATSMEPPAQPKRLKGITAQRIGDTLVVSWPAQPAGSADGVYVEASGTGIWTTSKNLPAGPDGAVRSTARLRLFGVDVRNSDFNVYVATYADTDYGPSPLKEGRMHLLATKSPLAVWNITTLPVSSDRYYLSLDLHVNATFAKRHCPLAANGSDQPDCAGMEAHMAYQVWVPKKPGSKQGAWVPGSADMVVVYDNWTYGPGLATTQVGVPTQATRLRLQTGMPYADKGNAKQRVQWGVPAVIALSPPAPVPAPAPGPASG